MRSFEEPLDEEGKAIAFGLMVAKKLPGKDAVLFYRSTSGAASAFILLMLLAALFFTSRRLSHEAVQCLEEIEAFDSGAIERRPVAFPGSRLFNPLAIALFLFATTIWVMAVLTWT